MAILDITTISGDSSDIPAPEGFRKINGDLNAGAGGKFIFLCVKEAYLGNPGPFVIDVTFVVGDNQNVAAPPGYTRLEQDLNEGAGGKFIYLCFLRGSGPAIDELRLQSMDTPLQAHANWRYIMIPQDLNDGAGGQYLYLYTRRDATNWMEQLDSAIGDRRLNRIAFPGTHDSGTCSLTSSSEISPDAPSEIQSLRKLSLTQTIVNRWAKAQSFSITEQLQAGVRYLDLRCMQREDAQHIYIVHSQYGMPVDDALAELDAFLRSHVKEIVILSLGTNTDSSLSSDAKLYLINQLLFPRLKDLMIPTSTSLSVTPAELWAAGKRLLVLANNQIYGELSGETQYIWNTDEYLNKTTQRLAPANLVTSDLSSKGTMSLDVLKSAMRGVFPKTYEHSDRLAMLGCCLTPDDAQVIYSVAKQINDGSETSLHTECASRATPAAARWLREEWQNESVNIIATDFFQMSQVVDLCILRNLRPRRFYIVSVLNGMMLDGVDVRAGTRLIMYPRNVPQSANQQWIL